MPRVTKGMRQPEETVGQRIRRLRLQRGLSQRQLAGPGVSYAYISRIESGGRKPSLKALRTIARKLDVDPEYLETGNPVSAAADRELRLRDAELELRLAGDLDRAEELLRGLLAEDLGEHLESRVRATFGTLLARRGDNEQALRELETVVASEAVRPETRPDVFEILTTVYAATGRAPQAIDLLERCIVAVDADDRYLTQRVRFRTFLAQTFSTIGALGRARDALDEAMTLAERLARPQDRIALYWTGARIEWMEAQDAEAALLFTGRAIGLLEATEDTMELARAHLLAAQICNLDHRPEEARRHLADAEPLLRFGDDRPSFGVLRSEQAKAEAQLGNSASAIELAQEAKDLVAGDVRFAAGAGHALALALAASGDVDAADGEYRQAVTALAGRSQWREAIQASRDWANALRDAGREGEALAVLDDAMAFSQRESQVVG